MPPIIAYLLGIETGLIAVFILTYFLEYGEK